MSKGWVRQDYHQKLEAFQLPQFVLFPAVCCVRQEQTLHAQVQLPRLYELARNATSALLRKGQTHQRRRHEQPPTRRPTRLHALLQTLLQEPPRICVPTQNSLLQIAQYQVVRKDSILFTSQ